MADQRSDIVDWVEFVKSRMEVDGVTGVHVDDVTHSAGGFSAQIVRLTITAAEASRSVVLKRTKPEAVASSVSLGIAREAEFFSNFAILLDPDCEFLPKVYYSAVEFDGYKVVIMEDLKVRQGVQSGYFFGNNSCINWGKDLTELTKNFSPHVTEREITLRAFELGATLHGRFWQDATLLEKPYLRASGWITGKDRESFDSIANWAVSAWAAFNEKQKSDPQVKVDDRVRALIDNCCAKIDFAKYADMWKDHSWTMVHGDFHPANMMVVKSKRPEHAFDLILLDFEAVGVGSGAQDLGQYMISHTYPEHRRAIEDEALQLYHSTLNTALSKKGLSEVSLASIKAEYIEGGLCRWAWLFPVCCAVCPQSALQYFHDQMLAFLVDHSVDVTQLGMLRP